MKVLESQEKPSAFIKNRAEERLSRCHCIIAGFDTFGEQKFNPSQAIAEELPDQLGLKDFKVKIPLHTIVLPTCGEKAWHALHKLILEMPPDAVLAILLTGLASSRSVITLERFALNIRDYPIPDNSGHTWRGARIDEEGPEAIRTAVDIEDIVKRLRSKGIPAEISNYAGSFVCNDVYYNALHLGKKTAADHQALFLHLPTPAKMGQALRESKKARLRNRSAGRQNQLAIMRDTVLDVAAFMCEELVLS
jgi:pyroglutamyl-peptidase